MGEGENVDCVNLGQNVREEVRKDSARNREWRDERTMKESGSST